MTLEKKCSACVIIRAMADVRARRFLGMRAMVGWGTELRRMVGSANELGGMIAVIVDLGWNGG